ncbi:MAG: regulatory protein TetR [Solirubrobacterales bacterium]|jgi:AcrR family transcriptional regulator|nr:regulatory protein TetR [Solirubrobacterales bacterium]
MAVPPLDLADSWSLLTPEAKRERLLKAAAEVFVRDGLDAPMPAVAAAAGAGVGSVYRQFPSKRELLAELVVRRLEEITEAVGEAASQQCDRWSALGDLLWSLAERQARDDIFGEAMGTVSDHPAVGAATDRTNAAFERFLAAARAEGRLRADATILDVRLVFAATRAAKQVDPTAWRRILELLIDALDARRA